MPVRERILDTRGQAQDDDTRNVINAYRKGGTEARAAAGYHPQRGGRYDSRDDCSPTPEPLGTRVFRREIRTVSFPQCFRQPTSINKYIGETSPPVWLNDYRLACQLGRATTDEVIIHYLPLHLRTWPGRGSNTCRPVRSTIGTTWFARSCGTSRERASWKLLGPAGVHLEA
jgi:hypothetical protein